MVYTLSLMYMFIIRSTTRQFIFYFAQRKFTFIYLLLYRCYSFSLSISQPFVQFSHLLNHSFTHSPMRNYVVVSVKIVANLFLANQATSATFATILVDYLLARLHEMGCRYYVNKQLSQQYTVRIVLSEIQSSYEILYHKVFPPKY